MFQQIPKVETRFLPKRYTPSCTTQGHKTHIKKKPLLPFFGSIRREEEHRGEKEKEKQEVS